MKTCERLSHRGWPVDVCLAVLGVLDVFLRMPIPHVWQTAVSFGAAGALLLRRRLPRLTLLLCLPGLYAGAALLAAFVALGSLAHRRRMDRQVKLAVAAVVVGSFLPWPLTEFSAQSVEEHSQTLLYALLLGIAPAVIGLLVQTRRDLSDRVEELATVREHERELHARTILAREHARLAREMHDVVAHQAGLMAVQAGALEVTARDPEVQEAAATLRRLATGTLEELRGMILVLRAAGAGPGESWPRPRLADLPDLIARGGVEAELRMKGGQSGQGGEDAGRRGLPEAVERTAYRTVQEGLTNVRKHAPGAATTVTVEIGTDMLRVQIHNGPPNGRIPKPDLPGGGHGIVGLRERAALLGGRLTAGPTSDGGFAVCADVPLELPG
ncbi:sensor histidine kinase [Streptomyces sp. NPDC048441]|uniref:sensor histidine kinase n=1 Tax=Streptomyces sp. NPDC048441 TaxID=3365552 RepID=UPI00372229DA